jgi:hypothetical protein
VLEGLGRLAGDGKAGAVLLAYSGCIAFLELAVNLLFHCSYRIGTGVQALYRRQCFTCNLLIPLWLGDAIQLKQEELRPRRISGLISWISLIA